MSSIASRVAQRYLRVLAQEEQQQEPAPEAEPETEEVEPEEEEGVFGGVGPFNLPDEHVAAVNVPKGGSCCANCKFGGAGADGAAECAEPNFVAWNGNDPKLPAPADEFCSDWWQSAE